MTLAIGARLASGQRLFLKQPSPLDENVTNPECRCCKQANSGLRDASSRRSGFVSSREAEQAREISDGVIQTRHAVLSSGTAVARY